MTVIAGTAAGRRVTSSSRFAGRPEWRASAALDGDPRTAWIGDWGAGPVWWQVSSRTRFTVGRLRLAPARLAVRRPTRVGLSWDGGAAPALAVGPDGTIALPRVVHTHTLRISVLSAAAVPGASAADQRAVGIGELAGIRGLPPAAGAPAHVVRAGCGAVRIRVGAHTIALRLSTGATAFATGRPVLASSCGPAVPLAAGATQLTGVAGPWAVDTLALRSSAPAPAAAAPSGDRILAGGRPGPGSWSGVRLRATGPSWLVLGEGYDRGWRAWCGSLALGAPVPIDGYANGWPIGPSCTRARFAFGPNRVAGIGYLVSAVAGILCLLVLGSPAARSFSGAARRRRSPPRRPRWWCRAAAGPNRRRAAGAGSASPWRPPSRVSCSARRRAGSRSSWPCSS